MSGSRRRLSGADADYFGKERNCGAAGNEEPCAEIIPEGDAEFCAGLGEPEEGVAAVAAGVAAGSAADLAPDDLAADVVLRTVGVQPNLRPVEHLPGGGARRRWARRAYRRATVRRFEMALGASSPRGHSCP